MTNDGLPVLAVKKFSPELRERFTQQDRDEANQRLQEAFENERKRRELPKSVADTSESSVKSRLAPA